MAVAFRAAGTSIQATGATLSPVIPAGTKQDDLLICGVALSSGIVQTWTMTGWTRHSASDSINANGCQTVAFYKVAGASDAGAAAPVSWTTSVQASAGIVAYSGVDATSSFDAQATATGSGTVINYGTIVVPLNDVAVSVGGTATSGGASTPAGFTNRTNIGTVQPSLGICDRPYTAGTSGGISNTTAGSAPNAGLLLALRPAQTPAFRVGTGDPSYAASGGTRTAPAGQQIGDLLIAGVELTNSGTITPPAGWTQRASTTYSGDGTTFRQYTIFTKTATSATADSGVWTWTGGGNGGVRFAIFAGVGDVDVVGSFSSSSTTSASVTTTAADDLILHLGYSYQGTVFGAPAGMTEFWTAAGSTFGFMESRSSPGATGSRQSSTNGNTAHTAIQIALKPPPLQPKVRGVAVRSSSTVVTAAVVDVPANVVNGDAMVMQLYTQGVPTTPVGWTLIESQLAGSYDLYVYTRTASSEPATYTVTQTNGSFTASITALVGSATVDVDGSTYTAASSDQAVPSVTTSGAPRLLLFSGQEAATTVAPVWAPPVGSVEVLDASGASGGTGVGYLSHGVAYEVQPVAAATGPRTYVHGFVGSAEGVGYVLAMTGNVAPNAPTIVTLTGGVTIDRAVINRADWDFSDLDPGDTQSKFDLDYRIVGAPAWTTITTTTTNTFHDFAAGFLAAANYEWRVRTYDALGLVGAYSATSFFTAANAPAVPTITAPINESTVGTSTTTVTWSAPAQTSYQVRKLADLAGVADTATVYSDTGEVVSTGARAHTLAFPVNNRWEHLQVRVKADGLWSTWASVRVQISYTPPASPTVVLVANTPVGAISISATHPTPGAGQPAVTSMQTHRRVAGDTGNGAWIKVVSAGTMVDTLAPSATGIDYVVASGVSYQYRVLAVADNGTATFSAWVS